jgi:hypothetical protein
MTQNPREVRPAPIVLARALRCHVILRFLNLRGHLSLLRGRNTPFLRCGKRSYAQTPSHLAPATTNIIIHWYAPMCTRRLVVTLIIRLALSIIHLSARCRLPILPLLYKRILCFRLYHIWVQYYSELFYVRRTPAVNPFDHLLPVF